MRPPHLNTEDWTINGMTSLTDSQLSSVNMRFCALLTWLTTTHTNRSERKSCSVASQLFTMHKSRSTMKSTRLSSVHSRNLRKKRRHLKRQCPHTRTTTTLTRTSVTQRSHRTAWILALDAKELQPLTCTLRQRWPPHMLDQRQLGRLLRAEKSI